MTTVYDAGQQTLACHACRVFWPPILCVFPALTETLKLLLCLSGAREARTQQSDASLRLMELEEQRQLLHDKEVPQRVFMKTWVRWQPDTCLSSIATSYCEGCDTFANRRVKNRRGLQLDLATHFDDLSKFKRSRISKFLIYRSYCKRRTFERIERFPSLPVPMRQPKLSLETSHVRFEQEPSGHGQVWRSVQEKRCSHARVTGLKNPVV
eukprot:3755027-Amphidinium_carterae.1